MIVLWACILCLLTPIIALSAHTNPYLDSESFKSQYDEQDRHSTSYQSNEDEGELSDHLAIQVKGETRHVIELAHKYGLHYLDQVFEHPAIYHLHNPRRTITGDRPRRDVDGEETLVKALAQEPHVEWVNQEVSRSRVKRGVPKKSVNPNEVTKEERTHYKIPTDVLKSKRSLNKVLHRHSIPDYPLNSNLQVQDIGKIINYASKQTAKHRAQESYDLYGQAFASGNHQNLNKNSYNLNSKDDPLVQVPLSEKIAYGADQVKARFRVSSQEHYEHVQSNGRIYIPRDRQLKNDIEMLSKDSGNATDIDSSIEAVHQRNDMVKDFVVQTTMNFNDPLYKDQWYLDNVGQLGHMGYDLNVTWAWHKGYTGHGIVVSVLDDGIQTTNADISYNYLASISYSLIRDGGNSNDPSPRLDPQFTNSHGTYCAAIIAAVHNNSVCGVGVAYHSQVGGVRIVDGKVTDIQEATALSRHIDHVDVFSASWGPTDDGTKVEGPGKLAKLALFEGITKGRNGKGVLYVWASGNGGIAEDNCNLDGYTSSIYTLSVSALTDSGFSTFYGEPCASTLAAVYVGGEHTLEAAIERKKKHFKELRVVVPELDGHCSETFQGTSAAAPLMAGVVALVLQANENLTWRDVQHLVVETSVPTPQALTEPGWQSNGKGKRFHLMQGFGAVNAGRMVAAALNWKNVKPQKIIVLPMFSGYRDFKPFQWLNITRVLDSSAVNTHEAMTSVEHVVANITVSHPQRKLLTIFIVSPSGTSSQVLTHRRADKSRSGFNIWGFMTIHFWGEDPQGMWTVALKDDSGKKGYLKKIETTIYGS